MPWTAKHLASSWYAPSLMSRPFCCIANMDICVYQNAANCVTHINLITYNQIRGTCSPTNIAGGCGLLY